MSKLFYRLNSLSKYLKCHKLLDESHVPIILKINLILKLLKNI